jgi:hypothetical protein
MIWTRRLKRWGGLANLQAKRSLQIAALEARMTLAAIGSKPENENIKLHLEWLRSHPLRVLGATFEVSLDIAHDCIVRPVVTA